MTSSLVVCLKMSRIDAECSIQFLLFFWLCDITVNPRPRLNNEGWNYSDGLALDLNTYTHLVCVARLTPWTLGKGTTIANEDAHPGDLWLRETMFFSSKRCEN